MSQKTKILKHLKDGNSLTPIDALNKFGTFRLAARISDLRQDGYNIETDNSKGYARYFLKELVLF